MNPQYFLTKSAEADLIDIIIYTLNTWGEEQVLIYQKQLESRLNSIVQFPDIGHKHPKLFNKIYYIVEGKHYIFYKKIDEGIEVLRFLHYKMNVLEFLIEDL